jgi:hypothetical protein
LIDCHQGLWSLRRRSDDWGESPDDLKVSRVMLNLLDVLARHR